MNDANIYMNPEMFGLQLLASHDIDSNDFDMVCVWFDPATDKRYAGHDSGCSCRVPFEDWVREDLSEVRTLADVVAVGREAWSARYLTASQLDTAVADLVGGLVSTWRDALNWREARRESPQSQR